MNNPKISQQITFLHTQDLEKTRQFYSELLGLFMVRDQETCLIFRVTKEAYLGFCEHIEPIASGRKVILTLVSDDVDGWFAALKKRGAVLTDSPKANAHYQIYHFFIKDPNGYLIEIQRFDNPI